MLEEYLAEHLQYPLGFPYSLAPAAVLIREVRQLKVAALAKADLPPVHIEALLKGWLAGRVSEIQERWSPGLLAVDIQLTAGGTVSADGTYQIDPQSAVLKAWWRDMALTFPLVGK